MTKPKRIRLDTLKPNERNPRSITEKAFEKLCRSIKRDPAFMELRPIVIDKDRVIIGGNQRYQACLKNGMKDIPASWVVQAGKLTKAQRKRFIVVDNGPAQGEWNREMLLEDFDFKELDDLGLEFQKRRLAEDIAAEPEHTPQHAGPERHLKKMAEKIKKLQADPGRIKDAKAVIFSADSAEVIIIADDTLADFLAELRRYQDNGQDSPLEKILDKVHPL